MHCIRIEFFCVILGFLAVSCVGKNIVPHEVAPEPEKDPSDLGAERRRVPAFGQPGVGGSFPIAPPENDLERSPAPDDDSEAPSNEEDERNDAIGSRRIPDEGFFIGRPFSERDEGKEDSNETDVEKDEIPEVENEIDRGKLEEVEENPDILEESERNGVTDDDQSKQDDNRDSEDYVDSAEYEKHEDEKEDEGLNAVTGAENPRDPHGFIFNNPFFSFRRFFKNFSLFEKLLDYFFRRTMDELPMLNGTYANTTEENVDIDGRMFHVIRTIIRGRNENNTVYIETLSPVKDSNGSQVVKEGKL